MSRSFKKYPSSKSGIGTKNYNSIFRKVNKIRLKQLKELKELREVVNQYDIVDYKSTDYNNKDKYKRRK